MLNTPEYPTEPGKLGSGDDTRMRTGKGEFCVTACMNGASAGIQLVKSSARVAVFDCVLSRHNTCGLPSSAVTMSAKHEVHWKPGAWRLTALKPIVNRVPGAKEEPIAH